MYIVRRPNGLLRMGFDIWKLNANLRPAVIERMERAAVAMVASIPPWSRNQSASPRCG